MLVTPHADPADVLADAGWSLEPRGACRDDVCVPLGGAVTLADIADRLGMPLVTDEQHGLLALGPTSFSGRALSSVAAPDLALPHVLGDDVWRLADQRGRRTVIVAWAPW